MKKLQLIVVVFVLSAFSVFGQTADQEEIAHFLFFPDSSNELSYRAQSMSQLDSLAENLKARNLVSGQIHVYGYSAVAVNRIEPVNISLERAVFIINELKERGVPGDLFSEPKGFGEVNLWGDNTTPATKYPNRRVRIMLDKITVAIPPAASAVTAEPAQAQVKTEVSGSVYQETARNVNTTPAAAESGKKNRKWLWLLLLLLLILAIVLFIFFLFRRRKKSAGETAGQGGQEAELSAAAAVLPVIVSDNANNALNNKRSKYMELENAIREIISAVPSGHYIDLHTIVSRLLQTHDDIYFTNIGNYTTAAHYHSKISSVVTDMKDIVELIGKSYSRNIHFNFSECNLFRKK